MDVFGLLNLNIDKSVSKLNDLDVFVSNAVGVGLDDDLASVKEVWEAMLVRESILRQKSKCRWVHFGDVNSKYFHSIMKGRFKRNNIVILDSGHGLLSEVGVCIVLFLNC